MIVLEYGHRNKMIFSTPNELYYSVGFLASSKRTSLHHEHNEDQGAWGSESRIHCHSDLASFPKPLFDKFTKGNSASVLKRINCNPFLALLIDVHSFTWGGSQNIPVVRATIPPTFLADFNAGLSV